MEAAHALVDFCQPVVEPGVLRLDVHRGLQRVDRIEIEPVAGAEPAAGENQEG